MKVFHLFMLIVLVLLLSVSSVFAEAVMIQTEPQTWMPILHFKNLSTRINISDQVANVVIDQTFENIEEETIIADYMYPLPENASIVGFGFYEADSIHYYELVIGEQGGVPGGGGGLSQELEDYLGPNPFICPVYDIEEGDITMRLEYTELLSYDFGTYSLSYPLGMDEYLYGTIDTLSIDIVVESQRDIVSAMVSNYPAEIVHQTPDSIYIHFEALDINPQENLVLELTVDQNDVGLWMMPHRSNQDSSGFFLAVLDPGEVTPDEIINKTFTFVLDRSGSMSSENRIVEARGAAIYCIEHLSDEDYFNVISFNSNVNMWQSQPVIASQENVSAAVTYIQALTPSGGTNLNGAMVQAVTQEMSTNTANQILLLSDGVPTSGVTYLPTILENISDENINDASVFTVGVGDPNSTVDLDFLHMIAYENHGLSIDFAPGTGQATLEEAITTFYTRFSTPVLINVELDYSDALVDEIYPPSPYNIFAGTQTFISGRYQPATGIEITVNGSIATHQTSEAYGPFDFPDYTEENSFVPRMWAIQKIDYWMAWMSVNGEEQWIIDMIIELSLRYGIVTEYTTYETPVEENSDLKLEVTRVYNGVQLQWTLLENLGGEVEYDVYRRNLTGTAWLKLNDKPISGNSYIDRNTQKDAGYVYKLIAVPEDGFTAEIEVTLHGEAASFCLLNKVTPNPFNQSAKISFNLANAAKVKLEVYDILGRLVTTLWNKPAQAGTHHAIFDGARMASGVYFVRISALDLNDNSSYSAMQKITLLK